MLKIPSRILLPNDELLVEAAMPERSRFLYKKWLRYYFPDGHLKMPHLWPGKSAPPWKTDFTSVWRIGT